MVWVHDEAQIAPIQRLIEAQARGELDSQDRVAAEKGVSVAQTLVMTMWRLGAFFRTCPLASVLAVLCLIVAGMSQLGREFRGLEWLFFPPVAFAGFSDLALQLFDPTLFLRALTPALLHFGEIHLVFNLLWLFYFGRQIERAQPWLLVAVVYAATALAGNVAQYYFSGSNAFGGLSGLIYGLVGYTWVLGVTVPSGQVKLRTSTFWVFVIALFGMALFASDSIASEAHAGGLIAGLIAGFFVALWQRSKPNSTPSH